MVRRMGGSRRACGYSPSSGQVDSLHRYAGALGRTLRVEVQVGEETFQIALIQSPNSPARV